MQPTTFGDLLRRERLTAGLTQAELAERARLSVRGVSDLERGLILRPYRRTVRALADALGLSDDAYRALEASVVRARRSRKRAGSATASRLFTVPSFPTQFLGRTNELQRLEALLRRDDVRLVTLTGPGGVGKTRLAVQAASRLRDAFPDGISFVSLGSLSDPALVPHEIAAVLSIPEGGRDPLEALIDALHGRHRLLVLDSFEHLTGAAMTVSALLAKTMHLSVLVTSRVRLHLEGEHEVVVEPFTVPESLASAGLERAEQHEAIVLFVQRARAVRSDFALTDENMAAVAGICARLDGLPLAIELAASRVKLFSPPDLLARLTSRLSLLTEGPRDAPPRHRSLRDTMEWSFRLLPVREQRLFGWLSVFAGGWSLDGAQAVAGDDTDLIASIASLVDSSLIAAREVTGGEMRFSMLETIREYASEQLDISGEREQVEERHSRYIVDLVEGARRELESDRQAEIVARLQRDRDNVRAVLERAVIAGDAERAIRLAGAMAPVWEVRSDYREGAYWLETALALSGPAHPALRARALLGAGGIAYFCGTYDRASSHLLESLDICRTVQDAAGAAAALRRLALVAWNRGEYEEAQKLGLESLQLSRAADDRVGISGALGTLGAVAYSRGELEQACALYEESLQALGERGELWTRAIQQGNLAAALMDRGILTEAEGLFQQALAGFRALGEVRGVAVILSNLGQLALLRHDLAGARSAHQEALDLSSEIGDAPGIARSLFCLAEVALADDMWRRSVALYHRALAMFQALGHGQGVAWCLQGLACAVTHDDAHSAAMLFGAAARLREEHDVSLVPWERERQERYQDIARAALGDLAWFDSWKRGHSLTVEEASRLGTVPGSDRREIVDVPRE